MDMGWLAAGICTVVAVFGLYAALHKSNNDKSKQRNLFEAKTVSVHESAHGFAKQEEESNSDPAPVIIATTPSPSLTVTSDGFMPYREANNAAIPTPSISQKHAAPSAQELSSMKLSPLRSSSPPRLKPPTFSSMAAPPRPSNGTVRPPPSSASSLRVPPTKVLSNTAMAPYSLSVPKGKSSRQVVLQPGHSPMDWAALIRNPNSRLRGKDAPDNLVRITPSQLKQQTGRKGKDAWTVYQGKVYNITPYLSFHPGGEPELMKGAGRDSGKLFQETHPWVNWDGILNECMVGILVTEDEGRKPAENGNPLDDMD